MKEFIAQFTKQALFDESHVRRISKDFFLVSLELTEALQRIKLPPLAAGLFLGRASEKTSKPGIDLLQMLAKTDAKKVWLNGKGAWLFVCRRPALTASITKTAAQAGDLVLVLTERDECIGYGLYDGRQVKNYYDIGDFLRRERAAQRF